MQLNLHQQANRSAERACAQGLDAHWNVLKE
jgi:hypothetical protein